MHFEIPVLAFAFEFHNLALVLGWILAVLLGAFALVIIYKMLKGDINLEYLIAGDDGKASLSRFQFLIFTFVIAMSLFLITIGQTDGPAFKDIPGSILALLGISGGSYVVAKGVDANTPPKTTETTVTPNTPPLPPTTKTVVSEPKSVE